MSSLGPPLVGLMFFQKGKERRVSGWADVFSEGEREKGRTSGVFCSYNTVNVGNRQCITPNVTPAGLPS
jgi:hypothetical protein